MVHGRARILECKNLSASRRSEVWGRWFRDGVGMTMRLLLCYLLLAAFAAIDEDYDPVW